MDPSLPTSQAIIPIPASSLTTSQPSPVVSATTDQAVHTPAPTPQAPTQEQTLPGSGLSKGKEKVTAPNPNLLIHRPGFLSHPAINASPTEVDEPGDAESSLPVDNLTAQWGGLSIEPDLESGSFQFTRKQSEKTLGQEEPGFLVLGKVLTLFPVFAKSVEDSMKSAWKLMGKMEMQVIKDNLFLFKFSNELDRRMVCREGPWRHQEATFAVKETSSGVPYTKEAICEVPYWVQVYEIPPQYRDDEFLQAVGKNFFRFFHTDPVVRFNKDLAQHFMRIRVAIDARRKFREEPPSRLQLRSPTLFSTSNTNDCFVFVFCVELLITPWKNAKSR